MIGRKNLTEKQKDVLREIVNFTCEGCKKSEEQSSKLQPHRIKPQEEGGLYKPSNIQMLCSECHEIRSSAQRMSGGLQ